MVSKTLTAIVCAGTFVFVSSNTYSFYCGVKDSVYVSFSEAVGKHNVLLKPAAAVGYEIGYYVGKALDMSIMSKIDLYKR